MRLLMFFLFMLVSIQANAASLGDVFKGGVFGTQWNASLSEVVEVYPAGKKSELAGLTFYEITDGRSVFGLDRSKASYIKFHFNALDQLNAVTVEMPSDFSKIESAISVSLGLNPKLFENSYTVMKKWVDSSRVEITLMLVLGTFSDDVLLIVEKKPESTDVNKAELGF